MSEHGVYSYRANLRREQQELQTDALRGTKKTLSFQFEMREFRKIRFVG